MKMLGYQVNQYLFRKKNENIKVNLNDIEKEKEKISSTIKQLSKSIEEKTNVFSTEFIKENNKKTEEKIDKLDNKEQKNIDEVINRIFSKI